MITGNGWQAPPAAEIFISHKRLHLCLDPEQRDFIVSQMPGEVWM
jgi:hypothetical protein